MSWGTSPEQVVSVAGQVPKPGEIADETKRKAAIRALDYMGLKGGEKITDIALDRIFIGSCTNGRIEDLRAVAEIVEGKHINENLNAMIMPGSGLVKAQAEVEGLDKIFKDAGFEWREPRLFHVSWHEPGSARARRALRLNVKPQLRGASGPLGPNPSRFSANGSGGGHCRTLRRYPQRAVAGRTSLAGTVFGDRT